jgi:hypothetical protein
MEKMSDDDKGLDSGIEDSQTFRCLLAHGVSQRKATVFLERVRCVTEKELSLFLRFQLPPLEYANDDAVNRDMSALLGVCGRKALRLLQHLDVFGAFDDGSVLRVHYSFKNLRSVGPAPHRGAPVDSVAK